MQHVKAPQCAVIRHKDMAHDARTTWQTCSRHKEQFVSTGRSRRRRSQLLALTRRSDAAVMKLRTCCIYLFTPSHPAPRVSLTCIRLAISPFGTLTAPDGQVGMGGWDRCPSPVAALRLGGQVGDGDRQPLSLKQQLLQPHLTCLFPLRILRVAVASPFYRARPKTPNQLPNALPPFPRQPCFRSL